MFDWIIPQSCPCICARVVFCCCCFGRVVLLLLLLLAACTSLLNEGSLSEKGLCSWACWLIRTLLGSTSVLAKPESAERWRPWLGEGPIKNEVAPSLSGNCDLRLRCLPFFLFRYGDVRGLWLAYGWWFDASGLSFRAGNRLAPPKR